MAKKTTDFQKFDRPFSVRIPHELHSRYKELSGFERKDIQYKMVKHLEKLVR